MKIVWPKDKNTILTPYEQRVYGLLHILQGVGMIILGKNAPSIILPWISDKAQNHDRKKKNV